jgi:alanine racemase
MKPIEADPTAGLLTIDLDAVAENWRRLRDRHGGGECAAVVKADGYGLGAVPVGRRLAAAGCRTFFVAHPDEGVALRAALPDPAIFILNGLMPGAEDVFDAHRLAPVLNDLGQIRRWRDWCAAHGARPAAVQFDTGMARLGLDRPEAEALIADPSPLDAFADPIVMSHLACADEPNHELNARQRERFDALRQALPGFRTSLANSPGLFLDPSYHGDIGRPGVALYGGNPTPGRPNPMKTVVTLAARILQVREIDTPGTVGYGATRAIGPSTRLATLAAGYADGYLRSLSNRGHVVIGGKKAPVVGRVSMDLITVDITGLPADACRPGALATLLDDSHGVDALAEEAGTIGYEILTALGRRYHRRYLGAAD